jgi:polysaccharide pyruvyl transferase WcaK-like protein
VVEIAKIFHSHLGWQWSNWGDQMLARGVRNLMLDYLPISESDIGGEPIIQWNKETAQNISNNFKLFIMGGGGMIDQDGFIGTKEFFDELKIPFIVYSVGYNIFRPAKHLSQGTLEKLKYVQSKTVFFSVRDDGSKEDLIQDGFQVQESPDPAFFCSERWNFPKTNPFKHKYVLINTAGDCLDSRYKMNNVTHSDFCWRVGLITDFLLNKGYKVYFTQHVPFDAFCFNTMKWRPDQVSVLDFETMEKNGLSWIKNASLAISMRGHAQIIPISLGVPTISWSTQDKNLGIMKKLNLDDWNLDVNMDNVKFVQATKNLIIQAEREKDLLRKKYEIELCKRKKIVDLEWEHIKTLISL